MLPSTLLKYNQNTFYWSTTEVPDKHLKTINRKYLDFKYVNIELT